MFFSWTDEIHEKRKMMKDVINKAREENEPLASWKNRLEGNGFTRETVSHLSYAGVEYLVEFTKEDIKQIESYVNFEEIDAEVWEGSNILEKDTLWFMYSCLNRTQYRNKTLYHLVDTLKRHLVHSKVS